MRKLLNDLFYIPKYGKMKETAFFARLAGSVAVIVVCLAAMAFTAYAYFSSSLTSGVNTLVAASFDVDVSVTQAEDQAVLEEESMFSKVVEPENGVYTLSAGIYRFLIQPSESCTASTGYCVVNIGNRTYFTVQLGMDVSTEGGMRQDTYFDLYLDGDAEAKVTVTACLGTSAAYATGTLSLGDSETEDYYLLEGEILHLNTEDLLNEPEWEQEPESGTEETEPDVGETEEATAVITHVVTSDDTLYSIAKTYGSTIERIMAYNGIENRALIYDGQVIIIPPDDWQMPTEPDETEVQNEAEQETETVPVTEPENEEATEET